MGKYSPYPAYRTSQIEGVSEIPRGWATKRVRFVLRPGYDGLKIGPFGSQLRSEMLTSSGYKVYGQENVIGRNFSLGERYIDQEKLDELRVYKIFPGDILITMMGSSGNCEIAPEGMESGIMDSHLIRLRVRDTEVVSRFFRLLIDAAPYVKHQVRLLGKGSIMHGLNSSIIKELALVLPPPSEQAGILAFLDHETTKIDRLIAKQERLIELLKEKRQAVISHAVTKGLNPDAPMKDSGVEWLGEVPAHWGKVKIKSFCYINDGNHGEEYPKESDFTEEGDGVPFIRGGNLEGFRVIDDGMLYITKEKNASMRKGRLQENDILFMNRGEIGKLALIGEEHIGSNLNSQIAYLRTDESKVHHKYLLHFLASSYTRNLIASMEHGSCLTQFPLKHIANIEVICPPLDEQKSIAASVDATLGKLNLLLDKATAAIRLLKEHRTALISAAVTGKIDVRNFKPANA